MDTADLSAIEKRIEQPSTEEKLWLIERRPPNATERRARVNKQHTPRYVKGPGDPQRTPRH
jgi:hypothetical protein